LASPREAKSERLSSVDEREPLLFMSLSASDVFVEAIGSGCISSAAVFLLAVSEEVSVFWRSSCLEAVDWCVLDAPWEELCNAASSSTTRTASEQLASTARTVRDSRMP